MALFFSILRMYKNWQFIIDLTIITGKDYLHVRVNLFFSSLETPDVATSLTTASTVPSTAPFTAAGAGADEAVDVQSPPVEPVQEESFFTQLLSFLNIAKGKRLDS